MPHPTTTMPHPTTTMPHHTTTMPHHTTTLPHHTTRSSLILSAYLPCPAPPGCALSCPGLPPPSLGGHGCGVCVGGGHTCGLELDHVGPYPSPTCPPECHSTTCQGSAATAIVPHARIPLLLLTLKGSGSHHRMQVAQRGVATCTVPYAQVTDPVPVPCGLRRR